VDEIVAAVDARFVPILTDGGVAERVPPPPGEAWRRPDRHTAAWLTFLAGHGYTPADIERTLVDAAADQRPDGPGDTGTATDGETGHEDDRTELDTA
jgi:hypothetical protein